MSELGRVMHFDGDYAAAAGMYKRVLVRQPENTAIRTALAACMLELGDRGAAEACLRTSARSDPASVGRAIAVLASASHGRFFLQPSRAERFLRSQA
jgi:thioredoxin-like negative regulator of GroEL